VAGDNSPVLLVSEVSWS